MLAERVILAMGVLSFLGLLVTYPLTLYFAYVLYGAEIAMVIIMATVMFLWLLFD